MKNIKNCPTQSDVIDTIINNIDIRGIDLDLYKDNFKNSVYVALCKLFNDYQNKTSITYNLCITHLQNKFNIAFNKILEGSTQRYRDPKTGGVSTKKTSWIAILNNHGNRLLDYNTDNKKSHFWYSYDRVYLRLMHQFSLDDDKMQALMKHMIEKQYNMKNTKPKYKRIIWR